MWKDRLKRYFRQAKRSSKGAFSLWYPALFVVLAVGGVMFAVGTSTDGSFRYCSDLLVNCMKEDPNAQNGWRRLLRMTKCSYQTAWCDVEVLWHQATHKPIQYEPWMDEEPPYAKPSNEETEQGQAEMLEYLTSEDVLDERTEQIRQEIAEEEELEATSGEDLKKQMLQMRAEREAFEAERANFRKIINETTAAHETEPASSDILSGQNVKEGI